MHWSYAGDRVLKIKLQRDLYEMRTFEATTIHSFSRPLAAFNL